MSQRLGSAEWTNPAETDRRYRFRDGTIWLGRSANGVPLGHGDDRHVTLVAGTRGGKGTTSIIPTLLTWRGSMVVVDPKGENATVTAARRGKGSKTSRGMGQTVHVLDPFKAARVDDALRSRFNPLDALDPHSEEVIDEAARAAAALVIIREGTEEASWDEDAREMIKALILHILTAPQFEGRRTLITLRQLIMRGDSEGVEALRQAGDEDIPSAHKLLWAGLSTNPALNGLVAGLGDSLGEMYRNAPKQYTGVLQAANRNTEFIDSPKMQRVLAASDFKLSDLKTRPEGVSLYLSLPQRYMTTHYRWLRMMIALTIGEVETARRPAAAFTGKTMKPAKKTAARAPQLWEDEIDPLGVLTNAGRRSGLMKKSLSPSPVDLMLRTDPAEADSPADPPPSPVLMVLDEFAGLKKMEVIEEAVAQSAGHGVKLFFVLQSLEQLKALYKDNWETFLGNSGLKVFFNLGDNFSREYVSKLIGEMELSRETGSRSDTNSENGSLAVGRSSTQTTSKSVANGTSHTVTDGTNQGESHTTGLSSGMSFGPPAPLNIFGPRVIGMNTGTQSSDTESYGRSHSEAIGTSTTETNSESDAFGNSVTATRGNGLSRTAGTNETLHRRPLIHPDEIGRKFSSVDRDNPAYPGFALVVVQGEQPAPVRRTNYYEDRQFAGLFDPHPDHPFAHEQTQQVKKHFFLDAIQPSDQNRVPWEVSEGQMVTLGQPLFYAKFTDDYIAAVRAPRAGKIVALGQGPVKLLDELFSISYHDQPGEGPAIDPYADLNALLERFKRELDRRKETGSAGLHEPVRTLNYDRPPEPEGFWTWFAKCFNDPSCTPGDVWERLLSELRS